MPELGRAGDGRLAPDHPRLPTVSLREQSGDKAVAPLRGAPRAAGAGLGEPGASPAPAARGPRTAPHPAGLRGGSGGCGFGVGIAAGSRVRPPGKGVGSWEGTGGTAGSVDNVFGDVKDDLGSFCAQVMQRLIKKRKKKLRN